MRILLRPVELFEFLFQLVIRETKIIAVWRTQDVNSDGDQEEVGEDDARILSSFPSTDQWRGQRDRYC